MASSAFVAKKCDFVWHLVMMTQADVASLGIQVRSRGCQQPGWLTSSWARFSFLFRMSPCDCCLLLSRCWLVITWEPAFTTQDKAPKDLFIYLFILLLLKLLVCCRGPVFEFLGGLQGESACSYVSSSGPKDHFVNTRCVVTSPKGRVCMSCTCTIISD